jgi:tripartite-type tricarboxylate transporter receptor subunit TctC
MLRFNRKALLAGGALITLLLNSAMALAQGWPNRPLRMVIPYPAGGSVDLSGRRLIEDLIWSPSRRPMATPSW